MIERLYNVMLGLMRRFVSRVEQDNPEARGVLYDDLGSESKVLVTMACATHFAVWETSQYKFMHRASLEWLESGTYEGHREGRFTVGDNNAEGTRQ